MTEKGFRVKFLGSKLVFSQYGKYKISGRMSKTDRLDSIKEFILKTTIDGLRAGGAGKFIDLEKDVTLVNGVIKIKNISKLDYRPVNISSRMTPFEIGKLTAENIFRGNDKDPVRKNWKVWHHKVWDNDRIKNWVLTVKLPNNPVEWQEVNRLYGDDYQRKINSIVNSIIFASIYPKNKLGNPYGVGENDYYKIQRAAEI